MARDCVVAEERIVRAPSLAVRGEPATGALQWRAKLSRVGSEWLRARPLLFLLVFPKHCGAHRDWILLFSQRDNWINHRCTTSRDERGDGSHAE